jgi:hypothetical protein
MSSEEVENKAQKLTRGILLPRRLERLVDAVASLEKIADLSKIGALMRTAQ